MFFSKIDHIFFVGTKESVALFLKWPPTSRDNEESPWTHILNVLQPWNIHPSCSLLSNALWRKKFNTTLAACDFDPGYTQYKWSQNVDNEVVPCPITVDSHSDLLIFVSVTCMSWISLNTKYQLIGTIVLSVMYYPHVHVVNILQTFQSVIMRSRWTHHTSKYWPSSWCRGELTRKLSCMGSIFCQHKKPRQLHAGTQQKEVILYDQIYPSQSKESKQSTKMLLVCKAVFLIFLPSICSFLS